MTIAMRGSPGGDSPSQTDPATTSTNTAVVTCTTTTTATATTTTATSITTSSAVVQSAAVSEETTDVEATSEAVSGCQQPGPVQHDETGGGDNSSGVIPDKPPSPMILADDEEPDFPFAELEKLDEMINRPRWVVPVLPKGELETLLEAAINLSKKELDTRSEACQRFFRDGLSISFTKILTDEAVSGWKYEIHRCIYNNSVKLIELCVVKLPHDWFPLLDLLAMVLNPSSKFHVYNGNRSSETILPGAPLADDQLFARPPDARMPKGWLVDLVNTFGKLDGFQLLLDRFTGPSAASLSVPVIAALLRPFGLCYEVLTPHVVTTYFMPVVELVLDYLEKLTDDELKKDSKTEAKNDALSGIIKSLKCLASRVPKQEDTIKGLEIFRLRMILRLLQISSFNGKMNALNEVNKVITNVSYYTHRHAPLEEDEWLTAEKMAEWVQQNNVLSIVLRDSLHQPQYVEKLEKIIRFMIKEKALTRPDLNRIWEAQAGKHEAIVKNVHDLLAKLAWDFSHDQLDHLFDCFQGSWAHATKKQREKLLELIRRLAEDDKEGVMAQKVLGLLWNLAHSEDVPTEIMDLALSAHIKILDYSCSQDRDAHKMQWIKKFVEELKNDKWVLPALKQIKEICSLFTEAPQNFTHSQRQTHMFYRNQVITQLQNQHSIVMLVAQNLNSYMSLARNYAKEHPEEEPADILPDGRFNHIMQVNERLKFLRFLLKDGQLWLCEPQAKQIWMCLAENAIHPCDRENCFKWFSKLMGEEPDLDPEISKDFFEANILQFDPSLLTENGMTCFERFFKSVNSKEGKLIVKRRGGYMMDDLDLIGLEYLWRVVLYSPDDVADKAIVLLKDVYTNLGPRLHANQAAIHEDFLQVCIDRLKAAYDTISALDRDKDSVNRIHQEAGRMIRVVTVLREYISECDDAYGEERAILPLGRASRGKHMNLLVRFPNQGRQMDDIDIWSHTNDTLGSVRRHIDRCMVKGNNANIKVDLFLNGELLDPSEDRKLVSQLGIRDKTLLTAKLGQVGSNMPSSPDSSSDSSTGSPHHNTYDGPNIEAENCLPGVLMASNARNAQFLFQLADLGCELELPKLREGVRKILNLMPPDVSTMEKLKEICSESSKAGSPSGSASPSYPKLEVMYFDVSASQAVYNLEVTYALLMPALNPMAEEAFEFQYNYLKSGGVPLALNMLTKNNFIPNADINTRRSSYHCALKIAKLLLTAVGYAQVQVVADACQSDAGTSHISPSEHKQALVLQNAQQYIPHPSAECMTRNVAMKLGHCLGDQATGRLPDLNSVQCLQKIAWCTSCGALDLVHATMDDIHQAHEKSATSPTPTSPEGGSPGGGVGVGKVPDTEDVAVCREALEVLSVSLALCPHALDALNKDKAWQTFIIDLLLLCKSRSVRVSASDQFHVMATRCCAGHRPLLFFITLLFTVLGTTAKEFSKQSHEYFQLLCRLLNYAYICTASLPTAEALLNNEITWLKKIRENVLRTGEVMVEEALLDGHLGITKELLSLHSPEKKYHIGSEKAGHMLIKEIVEDFIFPASKIVIKCRKSKGELPSDQAIPVCGAPSTIVAAFELLVTLCTGCVQNLRTLSHMLMEMYYTGQEPALQEWEYVPPVGPRPPKGFVGLKNAGATCYMNSVLQQLFMIDPIRTCILGAEGAADENMEEEEVEEKGENETNTEMTEDRSKEDPSRQNGDSRKDYHNGVLKHVQVIFAHLACSKLQYYVPSGFWKHFRLWGEPVNLREQHDALEFFNSLVDSLDEALKALKYSPIVSKVMGGTFADQKICKGCPHRYSREESFTALNVDIRNHHNLLESLEQYVKGDLLEGANAYHCDKCNKKVDTVKRMCIKKLPPILAIQLKRFDYDWERECAIKFNDYFEFPREVDMDPYTVQGLARIEGELITEDGEQVDKPQPFCTKYRLVGVVVHSGQASGGHYYSYILHRVGEQTPRWYKFDDGEVSECKMEEEEEMKNQCFGGEYMGEVFDHMLKRMSYRRQKRWWNAYILIYERMEEYDSVIQKDTLTLTRSMQDLTITNKTSQVKMPAAIERCVRRQNIQYMHDKNQFSLEYFQFMKKLLTCNAFYVQPIQGQDRLTQEAEELATISVQLASKFLFDVGFHTKKTLRGPAQEWYDALGIHLRHSRSVRNWFAQNVLFSRPSRFAEYLLECPSTEVRNAFVKILVFLAHFSLQDEPAPHKPGVGMTIEGSMSLSQSILSAVLGLLNKEVSEHGRHLTSYFHLFYMYASLGLREKQQLLQLGVPGKLMQVALDEGPGPPIKYQYTELGKLYAVVSVLLRCCDVSARCVSSSPTAQMAATNPHGEASVTEPLMPIQSDVADLLYGRPSYVKKLIEDCNNSEETTKLLKFCSWENPHFSSTVLSELLWQVAYSYTYELRPYLDLLLQMLLLDDSWQNHRIHNALKGIPDDRDGLFDTIQRSKNHYQKRAYQCIKMMVSLFTHCGPAAQMLQTNTDLKRKWAFAVGWLNDELERRPYSGNTQYTYNNWSPPAQSNETSNGYFLERSHSAKVTLQRACELCPDEEVEEEGVREEGESPLAEESSSPSTQAKDTATSSPPQPVPEVEGNPEPDSQPPTQNKSPSPPATKPQMSPRQPATPHKQSPRQQDGDTGEETIPTVQPQTKSA